MPPKRVHFVILMSFIIIMVLPIMYDWMSHSCGTRPIITKKSYKNEVKEFYFARYDYFLTYLIFQPNLRYWNVNRITVFNDFELVCVSDKN